MKNKLNELTTRYNELIDNMNFFKKQTRTYMNGIMVMEIEKQLTNMGVDIREIIINILINEKVSINKFVELGRLVYKTFSYLPYDNSRSQELSNIWYEKFEKHFRICLEVSK